MTSDKEGERITEELEKLFSKAEDVKDTIFYDDFSTLMEKIVEYVLDEKQKTRQEVLADLKKNIGNKMKQVEKRFVNGKWKTAHQRSKTKGRLQAFADVLTIINTRINRAKKKGESGGEGGEESRNLNARSAGADGSPTCGKDPSVAGSNPAAANSFIGWQYWYYHKPNTKSHKAHYFYYNGKALCGLNLHKPITEVDPMDYPLDFDHPTTDDCQNCIRVAEALGLKKKEVGKRG